MSTTDMTRGSSTFTRVDVTPSTTARADGITTTVALLDEAVGRVRLVTAKSNASAAASYWCIGSELARVHDGKLWKLRVTDGRQAFTGFYGWALAELGIARGRADEMMAVARAFTVEQVEAHGRSKLELVTRLPREMHAEMLASIKAGARHCEVKARVQQHNHATGHVRGDGETAKPTKTSKATKARVTIAKQRATTRASDELTIGTVARKHTVPLYRRPDSLTNAGKRKTRATLTKHEPWGSCALTSTTELLVSVTLVDGALVATIVLREVTP